MTILGADDKAGLAAMLEVLQVIKEQQISHGQIQFSDYCWRRIRFNWC